MAGLKDDIELQILKVVKVALKQSAYDCPYCKGTGQELERVVDEEGFFVVTEDGGYIWHKLDAPCVECKGQKQLLLNWYDNPIQCTVLSHSVAAALGALEVQNSHVAETYLSCARDFVLKAVEASGAEVTPELLAAYLNDLNDELGR
jgi:hypothetical protein